MRDVAEIEEAYKRIERSKAKVAYGTDCGMFQFGEGRLRQPVSRRPAIDFDKD